MKPREQAWQMFDTEDKAIKKEICPYKYKEWNFKGTKYPNMAAREATKEELEADGACVPQPLFNAKPTTLPRASKGGK